MKNARKEYIIDTLSAFNPPTQNRFQLVQVELVFVGEESGEEVWEEKAKALLEDLRKKFNEMPMPIPDSED